MKRGERKRERNAFQPVQFSVSLDAVMIINDIFITVRICFANGTLDLRFVFKRSQPEYHECNRFIRI